MPDIYAQDIPVLHLCLYDLLILQYFAPVKLPLAV